MKFFLIKLGLRIKNTSREKESANIKTEPSYADLRPLASFYTVLY